MSKIKLLGKTPAQLKEIAVAAGLPSFTGNQIAQWMYKKKVRSIEEMTNLSKAARETLSQTYEVGAIAPEDVYMPSAKVMSINGVSPSREAWK